MNDMGVKTGFVFSTTRIRLVLQNNNSRPPVRRLALALKSGNFRASTDCEKPLKDSSCPDLPPISR
jgi:hypothetical protein